MNSRSPALPKSIFKSRAFLRRPSKRAALMLALAAAFGCASLATAQTYTFDGDTTTTGAQDGSGPWDTTTTDWWDGTADVLFPNTATTTAIFGAGSGAAGTVTVGTVSAGAINFAAPGSGNYTLSGGTITLGGTGNLTPTITNTAASTIGSVIAGGAGVTQINLTNTVGSNDATKALTLTGTNTFAGTWLLVNTAGGNNYSNVSLILNNTGSTLAAPTILGNLTIGVATGTGNANVTGVLASAANQLSANSTLTISGTNFNYFLMHAGQTLGGLNGTGGKGVVELAGPGDTTGSYGTQTLTLSGTGSYSYNGTIRNNDNTTGYVATNVMNLIKSGSGTQTLTGTGGFSYTGTTAINGGVLSLGAALTGTSKISFGGGTLQYNATTTDYSAKIANSGSAISIDTNGQNVTYATALANTNTGGLTKIGSGTLTLNAANAYTGLTTINGGTLSLGNAAALGAAPSIRFTGGTLQFSAANTTDYSGNIANSTGPISIDTNGQTVTFANSLASSNTGGLTKVGSGTLVFAVPNAYTGATTVSGGFLDFLNTSVQPAGVTTVLPGGGLALGVGGPGQYTVANINQYFANTLAGVNTSSHALGIDTTAGDLNLGGLALPKAAVAINKLGANALNLGAITRATGSTVDFTVTSGTLTTTTANTGTSILGGYATFGGSTWAVSAGDGTNPGAISGLAAGSYTASVAATTAPGTTADVDFQASNTTAYTGQTINSLRFSTASAKTLTLSGTNVITTGGILNASTVGNNATTITGGTLEGSAGGELFVINNDTSSGVTINSVIADNGTATGLTKAGGGTLTLGGTNTYTGKTAIVGGALTIGADINLGTVPASPVADQLTLDNGTLNITQGITTAANRGITLGVGGGTINANFNNIIAAIGGVISGPGALNVFTSNASGRNLGLNGVNTFAGGLNVLSSSYASLGNASAAGTGPVTLGTAGSGSTPILGLNGFTLSNPITVTAGGSRQILNNGNSTITGPITLVGGAANPTLNLGFLFSNNSLSITGGITGTGNLSLGSGSTGSRTGVQLNLSTTAINNVGTITNAGGLTSGTYTISAVIGSNVKGLISNPGTNSVPLVVSGDNSGANFFGDTTLTNGTINLRSVNALANSVVNTNATGGALTFGSGNNITAAQIGGLSGVGNGTAGGAGNIVLANTGGGALALSVGNSNAANGSVTNPNTLNPTYSGIISGAGSIIKTGSNIQTLAGANTYTGGTTVNAGTLILTGTNPSASAAAATGGTLVLANTTGQALSGASSIAAYSGGTLRLGAPNQVNAAVPVALGTSTFPAPGTPASTTGILSFAAGANQGSAATVTGGTVMGNVTTGGTVTGTTLAGLGTLTLNNTSTLVFSGASTTLVFNGLTIFPDGNGNDAIVTISGYSNTTSSTPGSSGAGVDDRLVFQGDQAGVLADFDFGAGPGVGVSEIALDNGFYEVAYATPVPEPASVSMLGGALVLGAMAWQYRRRSHRTVG